MSKGFSQHRLHRVAALVDEGSNPFELACMTEVFGIDRPEVGGLLYDFRMCARKEQVRMRQEFFTMTDIADISALDVADTLIVPNRPDTGTPYQPDVLTAIARAHARGTRLIGMCSGAFTLAEAGGADRPPGDGPLAVGREFRYRFPNVSLDEAVLFVDEGDILTSAGSAAALDLALHVVGRDHGAEIATAVARRLVFGAHRQGGQRQFIERPVPRDTGPSLAATLDWVEQHAAEPITVFEIAGHAAMSTSTLHRRFRAELGCTPLDWLTSVRRGNARRLLETTPLSVDQVAQASGMGTAANLRSHLAAQTGLTPTGYRRQFGFSADRRGGSSLDLSFRKKVADSV